MLTTGAHLIVEQERALGQHFDYIVATREDVFFLAPFLLPLRPDCDLVSKNCNTWDGINLRLQLLSRNLGLAFLSQRLDFYRRTPFSATNSEKIELQHARALRMRICAESAASMAITASRFVSRSPPRICFIRLETLAFARTTLLDGQHSFARMRGGGNGRGDCIPNMAQAFVNARMCRFDDHFLPAVSADVESWNASAIASMTGRAQRHSYEYTP